MAVFSVIVAIYMYLEQPLSSVPLIMAAVAAYCVFYFTSMLVSGSVNTVFICYMHGTRLCVCGCVLGVAYCAAANAKASLCGCCDDVMMMI